MPRLPPGAEVIAHRGSLDTLLIKVGTDEQGRALGVVWRRGFPLYSPQFVAAIAKFGYWYPYEGSQGILADIEKELENAPTPQAPGPATPSRRDRGARGGAGAAPR